MTPNIRYEHFTPNWVKYQLKTQNCAFYNKINYKTQQFLQLVVKKIDILVGCEYIFSVGELSYEKI